MSVHVTSGCATCRSDALERAGNGVLSKISDDGMRLVAAGRDGSGWAALYACSSCGAYRRAGVIEVSKDYHSVWLPIESSEDLAEFSDYLRAEANARGTTEPAVADEIIGRTVR